MCAVEVLTLVLLFYEFLLFGSRTSRLFLVVCRTCRPAALMNCYFVIIVHWPSVATNIVAWLLTAWAAETVAMATRDSGGSSSRCTGEGQEDENVISSSVERCASGLRCCFNIANRRRVDGGGGRRRLGCMESLMEWNSSARVKFNKVYSERASDSVCGSLCFQLLVIL